MSPPQRSLASSDHCPGEGEVPWRMSPTPQRYTISLSLSLLMKEFPKASTGSCRVEV